MVLFNNFALQQDDLQELRLDQDPVYGPILTFKVKEDTTDSPQQRLWSWTAPFSSEASTHPETPFLSSQGWRLAAVLNHEVVAAPRLSSGLREGGVIQGEFTKAEITRLTRQLHHKRLNYHFRLVGERVSPAPLKKHGNGEILFFIVCFILGTMFLSSNAGFILWVLQSLLTIACLHSIGFTFSLAGFAGIALAMTIASASYYWSFEKSVQEAAHLPLTQAIDKGCEKALPVILDWHMVGLIVSAIVIQFDAGPVKSFAMAVLISLSLSLLTSMLLTPPGLKEWTLRGGLLKMRHRSDNKKSEGFLDRYRTVIYAACSLAIVVGVWHFWHCSDHSLGKGWTGSYTCSITDPTLTTEKINSLLKEQGLPPSEITVQAQQATPTVEIELNQRLPILRHLTSQEQITWLAHLLGQDDPARINKLERQLAHSWRSLSSQLCQYTVQQISLGLITACILGMFYLLLRFELFLLGLGIASFLLSCLLLISALGWLYFIQIIPLSIDTLAFLLYILAYYLNNALMVISRLREEKQLGHLYSRPLSEGAILSEHLRLMNGADVYGTAFSWGLLARYIPPLPIAGWLGSNIICQISNLCGWKIFFLWLSVKKLRGR